MSKQTGGSAFPCPNGCHANVNSAGMSLRDYFASKAMQGMLTRAYRAEGESGIVAKAAYQFADAMLKEREK